MKKRYISLSVFLFLLLFPVLLLIIIVKTNIFLPYLEGFIKERSGLTVRINRLDVSGVFNDIYIHGLNISDKRNGLNINTPLIHIEGGLGGFIRREIGLLEIEGPEVRIRLEKKRAKEGKTHGFTLPFRVRKGIVRDATLIITDSGGKKHEFKARRIFLKRLEEPYSLIEAEVFPNKMSSPINLKAIINPIMPSVKEMDVKTDGIRIPDDEPLNIKGLKISGLIKGKIRVFMKDKPRGNIVLEIQDVLLKRDKEYIRLPSGVINGSLRDSEEGEWVDFGIEAQLRTSIGNLKSEVGSLVIKGDYSISKDILLIKKGFLDIKGLADMEMNGELKALRGGNPELNSSLRLSIHDAESALDLIAKNHPFYKHLPVIKGDAKIEAKVDGRLKTPNIKGIFNADIERVRSGLYDADSVKLSTSFHLKDKSPVIDHAEVEIEKINLHEKSSKERRYNAKGLKMGINDLTASGDKVRGRFRLALKEIEVAEDGERIFADRKINISGDLSGSRDGKNLELKALRIASEGIKEIVADVSIREDADSLLIDGSISYSFVLQQGIMKRPLSSLRENGIVIEGEGMIDGNFNMRIKGKEVSGFNLKTTLRLRDVSFNNKTETVMAEGMDIDGKGHLRLEGGSPSIGFDLDLEAGNFELLAGDLYGDFSKRPVTLNLKGDYNVKKNSLQLKGLNTELKGVLKASVSGSVRDVQEKPDLEMYGSIEDVNLKKLFDDYLRDAYSERFPVLNNLTVEGLSGLDIEIKGSLRNPEIYTHLRVKGLNITSDDRSGLYGINLDLPLYHGEEEFEGHGNLSVKRATMEGIKLPELNIPLLVRDDSVVFEKPVNVNLLGGELFIENTELRGLTRPDRLLHATLRLKDVELSEISKRFNIPRLEGTLIATVPDIVYTEKSIYTDGEVLINSFGGTIRVENFAIRNILTPAMSIESDIKIKDLDLSMVTKTFETGHISGIMKGYVKELVIVNGQPQHFIASLETVKKRGVPQKISVKALRKIQILGTGSGGSILDRGIYRFFKEYRYSRMGFRAYLKNDTLLLEGIEKSNGRGYIVKGSFLPPTVDVINYTQRISFKELVNRLRRIKK